MSKPIDSSAQIANVSLVEDLSTDFVANQAVTLCSILASVSHRRLTLAGV